MIKNGLNIRGHHRDFPDRRVSRTISRPVKCGRIWGILLCLGGSSRTLFRYGTFDGDRKLWKNRAGLAEKISLGRGDRVYATGHAQALEIRELFVCRELGGRGGLGRRSFRGRRGSSPADNFRLGHRGNGNQFQARIGRYGRQDRHWREWRRWQWLYWGWLNFCRNQFWRGGRGRGRGNIFWGRDRLVVRSRRGSVLPAGGEKKSDTQKAQNNQTQDNERCHLV